MKALRFGAVILALIALYCPRTFSQGCDKGLLINFNSNRSDLTANEKKKLDDVAAQLKTMTEVYIEVYGHTDPKGTEEFNMKLANERIKAVSAYLKKAVGKELDMKEFNFGESKPLFTDEEGDHLAQDRRVEVHVFPLTNGKIQLQQKGGSTVRIDKSYFAGCGICGPRMAITEILTSADASANNVPLTTSDGTEWATAGMVRLQTECPELMKSCAKAEIRIPAASVDKEMGIVQSSGQGAELHWASRNEILEYDAETHEYFFSTDLCNDAWVSIGKVIHREDIIHVQLPELTRAVPAQIYTEEMKPDGETANAPLQFTASASDDIITECLGCTRNIMLKDSGVAENGFTYYYTGLLETGFERNEKRDNYYNFDLNDYRPIIEYTDAVVIVKIPKKYANQVKMYLPGLDSSLSVRRFNDSENKFKLKMPKHKYAITFRLTKKERYLIPGEALHMKYNRKKDYFTAKIRKKDLAEALVK
jgi:hypothetical protein